MSSFPPKVHSGQLLIYLFFIRDCSAFCFEQDSSTLAISNLPLLFRLLSRDCNSVLLIFFSDIFSCREKHEHDMLNSTFCKNFNLPQNYVFCKYDRLAQNMTAQFFVVFGCEVFFFFSKFFRKLKLLVFFKNLKFPTP